MSKSRRASGKLCGFVMFALCTFFCELVSCPPGCGATM